MTHSLKTNGPVPVAAGGPPLAYRLFLKTGSLALPSARAFGLEMPKGVSVSWIRKAEFGAFSVRLNVVASGAAVEVTLAVAPRPMTVSG